MMIKKKSETDNEAKAGQQEQTKEAPVQSEYMDPADAGKSTSIGDETQAKIDYYIDIARRTQADFENYRKRTASVRAEAMSDGKLEAIKAFLPVIDNIDRAIALAKDGDAILEGLKLVRRQIDQTLSNLTVEEIGLKGDKFDPNMHEAVMQEPAAEGQESGVVAEVLQKGYKMGDKVIRYTMVKVTQ